jgi:magnesium-transporting ATPase (P-type)
LTKEGLDFVGCAEAEKIKAVESDFTSLTSTMRMAMISCHSLSLANGKPVGNFVDLEMFKAAGASLKRNDHSLIMPANQHGNQVRVLRRFEFVHAHAYMSVVCQDIVTGKTFVFLKGSGNTFIIEVEKVSALAQCPTELGDVTANHARMGCYIVAMAYKEITGDCNAMSREEVESGCKLLGILLFRNELRPDTRQALEELRNGGTRNVMITGDHPMTAAFIAAKCGMVPRDVQLIMVDAKGDNPVFTNVLSKELVPISRVEAALAYGDFELVVTGAAFKVLNNIGWIESHLEGKID